MQYRSNVWGCSHVRICSSLRELLEITFITDCDYLIRALYTNDVVMFTTIRNYRPSIFPLKKKLFP